jgi:hypothetical protein
LQVIPLLLYHFQRSQRGVWVLMAFLGSFALLMVLSWIGLFVPELKLAATKKCRRADQELYRPEPGIRAVHGGAGAVRHHTVQTGLSHRAQAEFANRGRSILRDNVRMVMSQGSERGQFWGLVCQIVS